MTRKQRMDNICSELWRSIYALENNNIEGCKLSLYRVLEMIDYNKSIDINKEVFRLYEYIAEQLYNPDIFILKECMSYVELLGQVPYIANP